MEASKTREPVSVDGWRFVQVESDNGWRLLCRDCVLVARREWREEYDIVGEDPIELEVPSHWTWTLGAVHGELNCDRCGGVPELSDDGDGDGDPNDEGPL